MEFTFTILTCRVHLVTCIWFAQDRPLNIEIKEHGNCISRILTFLSQLICYLGNAVHNYVCRCVDLMGCPMIITVSYTKLLVSLAPLCLLFIQGSAGRLVQIKTNNKKRPWSWCWQERSWEGDCQAGVCGRAFSLEWHRRCQEFCLTSQ